MPTHLQAGYAMTGSISLVGLVSIPKQGPCVL